MGAPRWPPGLRQTDRGRRCASRSPWPTPRSLFLLPSSLTPACRSHSSLPLLPQVLLTSSMARSTGRCWTVSWRQRPGTPSPQRGTGWSAENRRPTRRVRAERLGPTPAQDSTAGAVQRMASRSALAPPPRPLPRGPRAHCWRPPCCCPRVHCGQWPGPWRSDSRRPVRGQMGPSWGFPGQGRVPPPLQCPDQEFLQRHTWPWGPSLAEKDA